MFSHRPTKVEVNGDRGPQPQLQHDLTQELAHCAFISLLCYDDRRCVVLDNVKTAVFFDDVLLFSSRLNSELSEVTMQEAEWDSHLKLAINIAKCGFVFFTMTAKVIAVFTTECASLLQDLFDKVLRRIA